MNVWTENPFQVLTFIAAPAILTNASSLMCLGTSNRFARAIDRARELAAQLETATDDSVRSAMRMRQLQTAQRRLLVLIRALTAFYLAVGSFATACLLSLLGAAFVAAQMPLVMTILTGFALLAGGIGVASLVWGAGLSVWDTKLVVRILREETDFLLKHLQQIGGK